MHITFGPQLTVDKIKTLKDQGVDTIVCNRPDNEEVGQPSYKDIETTANALDMKAFYMPMKTPEDALMYIDTLKGMTNHTIYAYCRSGARSTALAQKAGLA